jgi:tRNA pseudouridine55 synthase
MHSALKRDGKPLYEYARAGITLEREARQVTIHRLELLEWRAPYLKLAVRCSKGTYIRVLGEDIGNALGCGAHLQLLRRTGVGALTLAGAMSLEALTALPDEERAAALAPVDALLSSFPVVSLDDELARRFLHGQRLALGQTGTPEGRTRVYRASDSKLLGTARMQEYGVLAPERLISASI